MANNIEIGDPKEYNIRCGIEEEFLIIDEEGNLAARADEMMVAAARLLERDIERLRSLRLKIRTLDPEPDPSQIEYVTLPGLPTELDDFVHQGRQLLADSAKVVGCHLFAHSIHPTQSNPNPMCGTHINVSVQRKQKEGLDIPMTPAEMLVVYNHLWQHLPILVALSANSPIYLGEKTGILTNRMARSGVLRPNPYGHLKLPEDRPQLVQEPYYGRLRYSFKIGVSDADPKVVANPEGGRLTDITPRGPHSNIDVDHDDTPRRSRVEARIFDAHPDPKVVLDLCYLCCALALEAIGLANRMKEYTFSPDPNRAANLEAAIRHGVNARFFVGQGSEQAASEVIRDLFQRLTPMMTQLGVHPGKIADGQSTVIQDELRVQTRVPEFAALLRRGKKFIAVKIGQTRTVGDRRGRRYKVENGSELFGRLTTSHSLDFDNKDTFVSEIRGIETNVALDIRGVYIPLLEGDRILRAMSEEEYMLSRFGLGSLFR